MKQYFRMYKKHPKAVALRILVTAAAALTVLVLFSLVFYILIKGIPNLKPSLFEWKYTSKNASMMPAIINTITMVLMTLLIAVPFGIGSAIYLTEYAKRGNKVVNIHTTTQLQVVLVKPERFENASEIADHLREKRTVVLNLESTNKDIARRLLDFLSGVAYANEGKIKKVAISTYIITPYNVDILGDLIDELENNGLYF